MSFRYIGSKYRVIDSIDEYIKEHKYNDGMFVDAFCGMGHVAVCAQKKGWPIWINDQMNYAVLISKSRLIGAEKAGFRKMGGYSNCLEILNNCSGIKGYIWREYSPGSKEFIGFERRYFTEENATKIDAIRQIIKRWREEELIDESEETILLTDLIKSVNEVANIAGTYGCFLSKWSSQSNRKIYLRESDFSKYKTEVKATNLNVKVLQVAENDLVYLDPPYTKRQYASYYHILETIVLGDEPKVEGVSGLRPWKDKASDFCYKRKAMGALIDLVSNMKAKRVLISYSNDGHIDIQELIIELEKMGKVTVNNLKTIGRYKSNNTGNVKNKEVLEYLIDFERR